MMHEIAAKRRRFGCRRIGVLLEREGCKMNHKKLFGLYQEESSVPAGGVRALI